MLMKPKNEFRHKPSYVLGSRAPIY